MTAEGKSLSVPKDTIEERKRGPSAMPADVAAKLSKTELRDLIEFLASLKTRAAGPRLRESEKRGQARPAPLRAAQSFFLSARPSPCRASCQPLSPYRSSRPASRRRLWSWPFLCHVLRHIISGALDRRGIGPLVGDRARLRQILRNQRGKGPTRPAIPKQDRRIDIVSRPETEKAESVQSARGPAVS